MMRSEDCGFGAFLYWYIGRSLNTRASAAGKAKKENHLKLGPKPPRTTSAYTHTHTNRELQMLDVPAQASNPNRKRQTLDKP